MVASSGPSQGLRSGVGGGLGAFAAGEDVEEVDEVGQAAAGGSAAFARREDRTKALMAGFQTHLAMPAEPEELIATVASLVGRTGTPAA